MDREPCDDHPGVLAPVRAETRPATVSLVHDAPTHPDGARTMWVLDVEHGTITDRHGTAVSA